MMKGKSGSEGDDESAQPTRRETKTANKTDDDDPVRFSTIYRMFEAKGAPPKSETGMMANAEAATRPPPPTNRLRPKKVSVSTMTEALAYDEGDVTDDDIHQTDDACGSSTFDQQTQIDDDWLERDDVNRSSNRRRLNGATSSASGANGDSEKRDYEGDSMSEDGAACQFELAAGGKVAPKIPVGGVIIHSHDEEQLMARGNRNSPELNACSVGSTAQHGEGEYVSTKQLQGRGHCSSNAASHGMKRCDEDDEEVDDVDSRSQSNMASSSRGKSVPDLPKSPKVGSRTVSGGGISVAGVSVGAPPNNQGTEWRSDYSNAEIDNRQRGTPLMKNEMDGQKNFGVNSQAAGEKPATSVSPGQAGMVAGPQVDRNPGGAGIEYHGRSGYSCDQVDDYPKTTHAKSPTQQVTNTLLEENYNVFDTLRLRTSDSPAGTASGRSSSEASVETYEDVWPSKSQKVASEGSGYRKDLTETEDGSSTNEKQSTGQYKSPRERKQNYQYDNVVLPDTHHHHQQQQQQEQLLHSTAVHHPSEPVPPPNSKESGTRKHSSSSGTRQEPSSSRKGQDLSSYGARQEPSSSGTRQDSSSYGTRQDSSPSGTRQDSSSPGTKQKSSSYGTGQDSSSPGTRQKSSSSSSIENAHSLGRDSSTYPTSKLQSTDEAGSCNSYEGVRGTRGTIQMRDVGPTRNAVKTQFAPSESLRKSMSTNTEEYTEYRTTKTCAELECQTDSMDDIVSQSSQSDYNVRDQSTDPDDEDSLDNYFWYFGDIDRELSEAILERMIDRTGSYLVRMSQRGGEGNPYTLSVVYLKRIYHLLIRQRSDGMFSIGKEKHDEKVFFSVPDLMTFYQNNFVELMGDATKKSPSGKVQLKACPRK